MNDELNGCYFIVHHSDFIIGKGQGAGDTFSRRRASPSRGRQKFEV
jgi:hypothetical protein